MKNQEWLGRLMSKGDEVFKVVALINDPAIVIANVKTGEQQTHIIGCRNMEEFVVWTPNKKPD